MMKKVAITKLTVFKFLHFLGGEVSKQYSKLLQLKLHFFEAAFRLTLVKKAFGKNIESTVIDRITRSKRLGIRLRGRKICTDEQEVYVSGNSKSG